MKRNTFVKLISVFLIISLLFIVHGFSVFAASKSKNDIVKKWQQYEPAHTGSLYTVTPVSKAPYQTGKLSNSFLQDGVNMTNFVRYLADLPDDVILDTELVQLAQHGAVLLAANGQLSHFPAKPGDMTQTFYDLGLKSTSSSNIAMGYQTLASSIQEGYMRDDDFSNIDRVGHRRWILNPALKKVGFGFADSFSTMQVFDRSRTAAVDYQFIAYPNKGYFPLEFFDNDDPWSITLNPAKYKQPKLSEVNVTLTSLSSNKTWTLNQSDQQKTASGEFFNVELSGYGVNNSIIFRPSETAPLKDGDVYRVKVSGIQTAAGSPTTLTYDVSFFTMSTINVVNEISILINGENLATDQEPVLENNRVLVPMRVIFEALGADITWNQKTKTVTAKKGEISLTLPIGSKTAVVNGSKLSLDVPAQIKNGRTLVPIRFVSEVLHAQVLWNQQTKTVSVITLP